MTATNRDAGAPSTIKMGMLISKLSGTAYQLAAASWLLPVLFAGQSFLQDVLLYWPCVAMWGLTAYHAYRDKFTTQAVVFSLRTTQGAPITRLAAWRALAIASTTLVWLIYIVPGAHGWKVVNLAFIFTAAFVLAAWAARSVAFQTLQVSLPEARGGAADKAARRANRITTCALAAAAVLWLLPLWPTPTGPSWLTVVFCVWIAGEFITAAVSSYREGGHVIQLYLSTSRDAAVLEGLTEELSKSFKRAVYYTYRAIMLSFAVFLLYFFAQAPQWKTVTFSFACTVIAMAAVFGAKLSVARWIFVVRSFAASMAAAETSDGSAALGE